MNINYKILDQYCELKHITYKEFGKITGVHWNTLYQVITGRLKPGKIVARKIEKYFIKNKDEIQKTVFEE